MRFDELNLNEHLKEGVDAFNYEELTQIQQETFLTVLSGDDLMACSQTGSGKTIAFLLPIMECIIRKPKRGIRALIITPTRELCLQIEEQIEGLSYFTGISSIQIFGGSEQQDFDKQKNALVKGADIIVSTPGRLISHLNLGYVDFSTLDFLILDEADEMLDMGFNADIMNIVAKLSKTRQTLMFSATMPMQIKKLAKDILSNPKIIDLNFSKPAQEIEQIVYVVYEKDKNKLLCQILKEHQEERVIVFVSTKQKVGDLSAYLKRNQIANRAISSTYTQEERASTMQDFKNGKINILITTNLLSRGIDVDNVNLILNYEIPAKAEDYVHRIGRTARAGKLGLAISFIGEKEISNFMRIEKLLSKTIIKSPLPEGFGAAPEYKTTNRKDFKPYRKQPRKQNKKSN